MTTGVVLVVDDNESGRRIQRLFLVRNGGWQDGKIIEAGTLKEAIDAAKRVRPALVSLDLSLSDSRGVATLQEFVEKTRVDPSIIWVVTASSDDPDLVIACLELGVAGVVAVGNEPWRAPRDDFTEAQKAELASIVATVIEKVLPAKIEEALEKQRVIVQLKQNQLAKKTAQALLVMILTGLVTVTGPYILKIFSAGFLATLPGGGKQ